MQMTLLAWLVLQMTDSPWLVALVGFFGMVPMLVLGLVGGMLADSADRHKILVSTQAAGFTAALVMAVLLITESAQYWHAYPIILVIGTAYALDMPSRRSLIHDLVGMEGVTNALALDAVGMSASTMLGPALAGVLITLADVAGGYVAVSLFYFVAVALLLRLNLAQMGRTELGKANLMSGLRYILGHRTLLATVLITMLMNLLMFSHRHMVPVVARDVLHVGAGLMGLLLAAEGIGAMVGAVLVASAVTIRYQGRLFMGGSMLALVALLLFSYTRVYFLSFPTLLLVGLGAAWFSTMQASLVMHLSKGEMRGTALGVISLAIGSAPLGALFIGGVADAVSPTSAIALNAALGIAALVLIGLLFPTLRQRIVP